jgi:hypothetical protein
MIEADGQQCNTDSDCEALGGEFAGTTCEQDLCVAKSDELSLECPTPPMGDAEMVNLSFAPIYANPPKEPTPFTVQVCGAFDLECAAPLDGPKEVEAGKPQDFLVPRGFSGHFEITGGGTLPGLYFLGRPVQEDGSAWSVTMPDETTALGLAIASQQALDKTKGIMIVLARDCDSMPLAGVTFENGGGGIGFYVVNNIPSITGTETAAQGAAGFFNVPIGTTILSAMHNPTETRLNQVSAVLRPYWVTYVEVYP